MNARFALATTLMGALAAGSALAQPVTGPYVSLGGGANFLQDERLNTRLDPEALLGTKIGFDTGPRRRRRGRLWLRQWVPHRGRGAIGARMTPAACRAAAS
ncbi:MAG: hypothetical protein WDN04_14490 [Rhodospirillales bacterium]